MDTLSRSWGRPCRSCGQHHARHEPHVYDYVQEPDEDLSCHICLQPLVGSLDTPCGHSYCAGCLVPYLSQHQNCPICRAPLTTQACRSSPLVLQKILDKLLVKCPNADQCKETEYPRGDLDDHLKYRCPGNYIACCYAIHGCQMRGAPRAVHRHQAECELRTLGVTRHPIVEGQISHVEVPRTSTQLGMTIVGGADTPLRCVVVQEVFADGLVGQDGRLQAGDQIVEVNGVDMSSALHQAVCQALRHQTPVLRLGVYREKVDAPPLTGTAEPDVVTVTLQKSAGQTLGIKLVARRGAGHEHKDGVFVGEVIEGSSAAQDNRLRAGDRIMYINGRDVRCGQLQLACELIHANVTVSLVVSRAASSMFVVSSSSVPSNGRVSLGGVGSGGASDAPDGLFRDDSAMSVSHSRTKSAPDRLSLVGMGAAASAASNGRASVPLSAQQHVDAADDGVDVVDRAIARQPRGESMDHLSAPDPPPRAPVPQPTGDSDGRRRSKEVLRRSVRIDGDALQQKTVTIAKKAKESLGLRVGGGISCNEGDTPIYIANINHQGPVGKSKQVKKGDILLSVNGRSLVGLTHSQAVAALKSTAELPGVTLSVLEGPETSPGPAKFIPSWMYWQALPRCLCYPRGVELSRGAGGSLGFSIVGGSDGGAREPIHVLFVVQGSPAAVEGRLRCGDRLLAVDGNTLEAVRHSEAVTLLKQTLSRVRLQVVSWMGTEV